MGVQRDFLGLPSDELDGIINQFERDDIDMVGAVALARDAFRRAQGLTFEFD